MMDTLAILAFVATAIGIFVAIATTRLPPKKAAAVKLLWLAICNIEDKRARNRAKERGLPPTQRKAPGRLVEGGVTTNWKQALEQLVLAYPDRINPYL